MAEFLCGCEKKFNLVLGKRTIRFKEEESKEVFRSILLICADKTDAF